MSNSLPTLFTIPELPADLGATVHEAYSMVLYTAQILISKKPLLKSLFEAKSNEWQEAMNAFASLAPSEANAIVGVSIATTVGSFGNGTFLYLTVTGTPIHYSIK